jgi:cytochrome o ubiquinol oxidase subunit III
VTATDPPVPFDPYRLGRARVDDPARGHGAGGPAAKRVIVAYGFWIFLLSDIVMFSAFFASYAVLSGNTNGGPSGRTIFDLRNVGVETAFLLLSSFSCGMASIAASVRSKPGFYVMMVVTFLLGAGFITLEVREFVSLIQAGDGPSRSAFLSAFFALVGCHGLHVSAGLLWLLTMIAQVFAKGFRPEILRRILCFSLFWHALDIIWVAVFTIVYLLGVYP